MAEPQENIQNNSNIQNNNIQSGSTFMDGNRTIDKVTFENEALRNFQGFLILIKIIGRIKIRKLFLISTLKLWMQYIQVICLVELLQVNS